MEPVGSTMEPVSLENFENLLYQHHFTKFS